MVVAARRDSELERRPVAAQDYWDKGLRRAIAVNVFRALLVARHQPSQEDHSALPNPRQAIEHMLDAMGTGDSLILFPEGTRGTGEEVATFKSGLYYLCRQKPGLRLVPADLNNLIAFSPKANFCQCRSSAGLRLVRRSLLNRASRKQPSWPGPGPRCAAERDMKNLDPQLVWAFAGVLALLTISTLIGLALKAAIKKPEAQATISNLQCAHRSVVDHEPDLRADAGDQPDRFVRPVWPDVVSGAARDVTLLPTRRADHRTLFWTILHLYSTASIFLIAIQWYGMFAILIPVYAFLFVPTRLAIAGDTESFLERVDDHPVGPRHLRVLPELRTRGP